MDNMFETWIMFNSMLSMAGSMYYFMNAKNMT